MISRNVEHEGKKYIVSLYATSYANAIRLRSNLLNQVKNIKKNHRIK